MIMCVGVAALKLLRYLRIIVPAIVIVGIFLYLLFHSSGDLNITGIIAMLLVAATLVYFIVSMRKNQK